MPVDAAHLVWAVSLGNVDFNPHPVRRADLDHPDELRVDIDPTPGATWDAVRARRAARARRARGERPARLPGHLAARAGCTSPCASSRQWDFVDVRRAALALAREVERRGEGIATSKWWKEERPRRRSSSTTTRTPRTTPSPRGTPSARCPTRASAAHGAGTRSRTASWATSASTRCPSGCGRSATRAHRSIRRRRRWTRSWSSPVGTSRSEVSTCSPRALGPTRSGARRRSRSGTGVPRGGASPGPAGGGGGGGGRDRVAGVPPGVGLSCCVAGAKFLIRPPDVVQVNSFRGSPYVVPWADARIFTAALVPTDEAGLKSLVGAAPAKGVIEEGYEVGEALSLVAAAARDGLSSGPLDRDAFHQAMRERLPAGLLPWCRGCQSHHVRPGFWREFGPMEVTVMPGKATWALAEPPSMSLDDARSELVRRFLRVYAPATHTHSPPGLRPGRRTRNSCSRECARSWWRLRSRAGAGSCWRRIWTGSSHRPSLRCSAARRPRPQRRPARPRVARAGRRGEK